MIAYLVYNVDYRLYEIHEEKPVYRYGVGWWSDGYHEGVSPKYIPEETQKVLSEKGMLEVITSPMVLFHTAKEIHWESPKEEEDE